MVKFRFSSNIISYTCIDANRYKSRRTENRDHTFTCTTHAARSSSGMQWYLSTTNITTSVSPQPDVCSTDCSDDTVILSSVLTYTGNIHDDAIHYTVQLLTWMYRRWLDLLTWRLTSGVSIVVQLRFDSHSFEMNCILFCTQYLVVGGKWNISEFTETWAM
jgi:hypothetical protein